MVTAIFSIFTAVSLHFISIQGLKELPRILSPTEIISNVIEQVVIDDSKLQEFLPIFYYFVNFTAIEKQSREEVINLTATGFIENDENELLYGSHAWQDVIIEALNEEDNVTGDLIETRYDDVVEYIKSFISKPENLKERYIQNLLESVNHEDEEVLNNETSTANETSYDANATENVNEFWDVTESRRIYRGNKTKIRLFPFMASVHLFDHFACAGSIISADLIITAASCLQLLWNNRFFRENPAFLSVRIGSQFFSVGGEKIPILEVYFYPAYVPKTLQNNLALMRLQRRIHFKRRRKSNVKKITIDRAASALSYYTAGVTIIGWGAKIKANVLLNAMSNSLHMAVLDFYDLESCRDMYGDKFVTKKNFCAGFITKGQGACNHDVGDPGVVGGTLMGVTSFGSPVCGLEDTPTVFTKLGYYADWIDDIMEQEVENIKVRTTTRWPSETDPVQLLGIDPDANKPLPPLRELVTQQPQKLGIEPLIDTAPAQDLETAIVVREGYQSSRHSEEEDTVQSSQEGGEIDDSSYDKDYIDIATMNPVLRMTKILSDKPPKNSMPRDTEEERSENIDDVIRTAKPFEVNDNKSDGLISDTVREDMWSESNVHTYEKDKSETAVESDHEEDYIIQDIKRGVTVLDEKKLLSDEQGHQNKHSITPEIVEDSGLIEVSSVEVKQNDVLRKQQDDEEGHQNKHNTTPKIVEDSGLIEVSSVEVKQNDVLRKQQDDEEGHQNKHNTTPKIVEDSGLIEVKSVEVKQDDVLTTQQDDSQTIYNIQTEQSHDGVPAEVSEDMIKREIEKLIRELDVSSEFNTEKLSENSKTQNNLNNNYRDPASERLTLVYISDREKKANLRTRSDETEKSDETLSIDPMPFQKHATLNDDLIGNLIGEKEVFEIFEDVINTMNNKTSN